MVEFQSFSIIDNQVVAKDKIEKDLKYTVINIDTFGKIENGDFERAYVSVCKSNKLALGDDKEEIVKKKIDNNLNNLKTTLENISKEFNVEKTFIDICTNFIFNEKVFEIVSIALSVGFISPVVICSFDKEKDSNFLNKINKQFNYSKDGEE